MKIQNVLIALLFVLSPLAAIAVDAQNPGTGPVNDDCDSPQDVGGVTTQGEEDAIDPACQEAPANDDDTPTMDDCLPTTFVADECADFVTGLPDLLPDPTETVDACTDDDPATPCNIGSERLCEGAETSEDGCIDPNVDPAAVIQSFICSIEPETPFLCTDLPDDDADGVSDAADLCPDTDPGASANGLGCAEGQSPLGPLPEPCDVGSAVCGLVEELITAAGENGVVLVDPTGDDSTMTIDEDHGPAIVRIILPVCTIDVKMAGAGGTDFARYYLYSDLDDDGFLDLEEAFGGGDGNPLSGCVTGLPGEGDADGDEISDEDEMANGTDPGSPDTDADGLTDCQETGYVAGGGQNGEVECSAGPAWHTDPRRPDSDGDGMTDGSEAAGGRDPTVVEEGGLVGGTVEGIIEVIGDQTIPGVSDLDEDGRSDTEEAADGTDPTRSDTDRDGLSDCQEVGFVLRGTGPNNPAEPGRANPWDAYPAADPWVTGVAPPSTRDCGEGVLLYFTNPIMADSDGDLLRDGDEAVAYDEACFDLVGGETVALTNLLRSLPFIGALLASLPLDTLCTTPNLSNPTAADTDLDDLLDGLEGEFRVFPSSPIDPDSDNDALPDGGEVERGTATSDVDEDGVIGMLDPDSDQDGAGDCVEFGFVPQGTAPNNVVDWSDGSDYIRGIVTGLTCPDGPDDDILPDPVFYSSPISLESDGDRIPDGIEIYGIEVVRDVYDFAALEDDFDIFMTPTGGRRDGELSNPSSLDGDDDGISDCREVGFVDEPDGIHANSPVENGNPDCDGIRDSGNGNQGTEQTHYYTTSTMRDSDKDGVPDGVEAHLGLTDAMDDTLVPTTPSYRSNPTKVDSDADTFTDCEELGWIEDHVEGSDFTAFTTISMPSDRDCNGLTVWGATSGTWNVAWDYTLFYLTNPNNDDTDGDTNEEAGDDALPNLRTDDFEVNRPVMPDGTLNSHYDADRRFMNPTYFNYNDAESDGDNDGLLNCQETVHQPGSSAPVPASANPVAEKFDYVLYSCITAHETLTDLEQDQYHTNPRDSDSDDDEVKDGTEALGLLGAPLSNPTKVDSDGDGFEDCQENGFVADVASAFIHSNNPGGRCQRDRSSSNGHQSPAEYLLDPLKADSDEDGSDDDHEVHTAWTNPTRIDTDQDGLSDCAETYISFAVQAQQMTTGNMGVPAEDPVLPTLNPVVGSGLCPDVGLQGGTNAYFTSPLNPDSDLDGRPDGDEADEGTNPTMVDAPVSLLDPVCDLAVGESCAEVIGSLPGSRIPDPARIANPECNFLDPGSWNADDGLWDGEACNDIELGAYIEEVLAGDPGAAAAAILGDSYSGTFVDVRDPFDVDGDGVTEESNGQSDVVEDRLLVIDFHGALDTELPLPQGQAPGTPDSWKNGNLPDDENGFTAYVRDPRTGQLRASVSFYGGGDYNVIVEAYVSGDFQTACVSPPDVFGPVPGRYSGDCGEALSIDSDQDMYPDAVEQAFDLLFGGDTENDETQTPATTMEGFGNGLSAAVMGNVEENCAQQPETVSGFPNPAFILCAVIGNGIAPEEIVGTVTAALECVTGTLPDPSPCLGGDPTGGTLTEIVCTIDPAAEGCPEPEPCNPDTDPTCVEPPCDPTTDPMGCDPTGGTVSEAVTTVACTIDPEGEGCEPEPPCDPEDPTCVEPPCDPVSDPECDPTAGGDPLGMDGDGNGMPDAIDAEIEECQVYLDMPESERPPAFICRNPGRATLGTLVNPNWNGYVLVVMGTAVAYL